ECVLQRRGLSFQREARGGSVPALPAGDSGNQLACRARAPHGRVRRAPGRVPGCERSDRRRQADAVGRQAALREREPRKRRGLRQGFGGLRWSGNHGWLQCQVFPGRGASDRERRADTGDQWRVGSGGAPTFGWSSQRGLSGGSHADAYLNPVTRGSLRVERLGVTSFRNIERLELEPALRLNVIAGDNGQGKTSIIEALYLAATSRSFRTHRLAEVIRQGDVASFIALTVEREGYRTEQRVQIGARGRSWLLDGKKPAR